jgi:hypothetical protein
MLVAVAQHESALVYASAELKGDREVVLAAVALNGRALQYASAELRENCEGLHAKVRATAAPLLLHRCPAGRSDCAARVRSPLWCIRRRRPSARRAAGSNGRPRVVRAVPGRLSVISVSLCKSVLYGAFVWAHRALNSRKRRFPARAVTGALQRLAFAACFSDRAAGLALPGGGPASAAELGVGLRVTPTEILFDLVWYDQPLAVHSFRRFSLVFTKGSLRVCFP